MSNPSVVCHCCSGKTFEDCCEPFLSGTAFPETAEQLMRSRYSAYVTLNVAYILETTAPKFRKYYAAKSILEWASNSTWISLEIVSSEEKRVKFIATYLDDQQQLTRHKEDSRFEKSGGRWYFLDGKTFD
ncbi:YchJ family metal-binding protein [Fluviicola sp.]|uniref:YchJ family protein n=1 Tax=Fluviicola sp. TaxID=1917219 RepID=UPI0026217304|nr:YchJ family metal-binding protein [Fluviicola sp.]